MSGRAAFWNGEGSPALLGANLTPDGVNIAVFSHNADRIEFCLFDVDGYREIGRFTLSGRSGDIHHGLVGGIGEGARYGLRAYGPYNPRVGHRFNPNKLLLDPYARAIDQPFLLDDLHYAYRPHSGDDCSFDSRDSASVTPKALVLGSFCEAFVERPLYSWPDTILYEVNISGFSLEHPDLPVSLRGTLKGLADPQLIEYFVKLGISSLELMPLTAWIDERHLAALGLSNRWGYNPIGFFAIDPRLAPNGVQEVKEFCRDYRRAGIEVLLDVVYNHSGESDELGPTLSFRGLDNKSYYRLNPGDLRFYNNDTGCGNTLALDRAHNVQMVCDSLRSWARLGFSGFRFDLASILGRTDRGFSNEAPLLTAISQDPDLARLKLIAEPWDIGPGGYNLGKFAFPWRQWNDRFRDDVRKFWRGDRGALASMATRLCGSEDLFAASFRPTSSINFIAAHDGFTLADTVAYTRKHNEANGENNSDGTNENYSWNHGTEGPTTDQRILDNRNSAQRSLLASLLLARGVPMISMGSELGHSQNGNNNAYAQNFAIDWSRIDHGLLQQVRHMIKLRKEYWLLRQDRFLSGALADGIEEEDCPDVLWLNERGDAMDAQEWGSSECLTMVLACRDATRLALMLNSGDVKRFTCPSTRKDFRWRFGFDSSLRNKAGMIVDGFLELAENCLVLLIESPVHIKQQ